MIDTPSPEACDPEIAPEPQPGEPAGDEPEIPVPTDFRRNAWLLFIVLGVVILGWLIAIVWRKVPEPERALRPEPKPVPAEPKRSSGPKRATPVDVSRVVGTEAETIVASPAVLLRASRTPYRLQRLFDVTQRADGFDLAQLCHLPGQWVDNQPLLALDEGNIPGTVPLGEISPPGPEDRVILIETPDGPRAYPVAFFISFFGLRDRIGDRRIVITWSALSQTVRCLATRADDRDVNWGDSGLIYRGDTVLYDVNTGALWDPFSGRALTGPAAGSSAPVVPLSVWSWKECQAAHPDAQVPDLVPEKDVTDASRTRAQDLLERYLATREAPLEPAHFDPAHSPLPAKAFVLGVRIAGEARAYPLKDLASAEAKVLTDSLGGRTFQVHVTSPRTAHVTAEGDPLDAVVRLWFAWKEVCPDTSVYDVESAEAGRS